MRQAPGLIESVGTHFTMKEFSGDKAYSAKKIYQILEQFDITPFIPYKRGMLNPEDKEGTPKTWIRMFAFFKNNNEKFLQHYHKRSNVESVFSSVKMRLGEFLKCKTFPAQRSELLMKFVCHNICCLVQEMFERGVSVDFDKCNDEYSSNSKRKFSDVNNLKDVK